MTGGFSLVTGATGFLGGLLVRRLREKGLPVRALVRGTSRTDELASIGVDLFEGDLADAASLARAVAGASHIFHIGEAGLSEKNAIAKTWRPCALWRRRPHGKRISSDLFFKAR